MEGCIGEIFQLLNKALLNVVFDFCLNTVFNVAMHLDAQLIGRLGGATKLAVRLGFPLRGGGVQRVQNWKERGIPAAVERDNSWIAAERRAMFDATQPEAAADLTTPVTQEATHG